MIIFTNVDQLESWSILTAVKRSVRVVVDLRLTIIKPVRIKPIFNLLFSHLYRVYSLGLILMLTIFFRYMIVTKHIHV
jgi:hypothetical protein